MTRIWASAIVIALIASGCAGSDEATFPRSYTCDVTGETTNVFTEEASRDAALRCAQSSLPSGEVDCETPGVRYVYGGGVRTETEATALCAEADSPKPSLSGSEIAIEAHRIYARALDPFYTQASDQQLDEMAGAACNTIDAAEGDTTLALVGLVTVIDEVSVDVLARWYGSLISAYCPEHEVDLLAE